MALVSDIQLQSAAVKPPNLDTSLKFSAEGLTATTAFALTDGGAGTTVSTTGQFTAKSANDLTAWFQSTKSNGDTEIYISNDARPDWSLKVSGTASDSFLISNSCSADGTVQGTALSISPAGAVGFGKFGATDALEINSLNSATAALVIANVTDGMSMRMKSESASGSIGTITNDKLGFMTNATTRGVFDTSGQFGIGTDAPGALLDVRGSVIFNEAGAAVDVRMEGDTETNLFFVDGSADKIGIGTATPAAALDIDLGGDGTGVLMCVNGCICATGYLGEKQGHTIECAGVALTQRTGLNFVVANVGTVTDDSGNDATVVCISGANTCIPFLLCDGSSDPISLTGGSIGDGLSTDSNPTLGGLLCGAGHSMCAINCITITGCYFGDGSQLSGVSSVPGCYSGDCTIIGCNAGGNVAGGATKITLFGANAGYNLTTADNIVVIGTDAALCMTTATDSVFLGTSTARCVLTCAGNVAVGAWAFYNECAGTYNTVVGNCAGYTQKGATTNTFVGALAGALDSTGSGNVFIGYKAGCANTTGSCCLVIGNGTCDLITGDFNGGSLNFAGSTITTGASVFCNTITVGVNDTGYDVTFFGATSGCKFLWDESADELQVIGTSVLCNTLTVGVNDTGHDVTFFGATSGCKFLWDESANELQIIGTSVFCNTITVGVNDAGHDVTFFGATTGCKFLWDESADTLILCGSAITTGASVFCNTVTVGVNDTGYDVTFFGATSGCKFLWDESANELQVIGTSVLCNTLTVGVNDTGHDVTFFGATTGCKFLWDESADTLILCGAAITTGASTLCNTLTVGVDDTGYDVMFYGATAGCKFFWDESTDTLILCAAAITKGASVLCSSSTIFGASVLCNTLTVGVNDTGHDVTFFGATSGCKFLWDESANELQVIGTSVLCNTLTVGVNDTGHDVTFFGATSGCKFLWNESADVLILCGAAITTGASVFCNTVTVGVDDTGYDVILYGDTASANLTWDTSADDLILNGVAGLIVPDGQFTLGSTAVTTTAAELNLIDGGTSRGTTAVASGDGILINDAGTMSMTNVDTVSTYFSSHSVGGSNIVTVGTIGTGVWNGTAVASAYLDADTAHLSTTQTFTGAKTFDEATQFCCTLTVGVDDAGYDVKLFGAAAGAFMLYDESANTLDVRGATAAGPGVLKLTTGELTNVDGGILGRLEFQAPLDSAGTDAILVAASIWGEANGTFAAACNKTDLVFATADSETAAEKMRITSGGSVKNPVDSAGYYTGAGDDTRLYFNATNAVLATAGAQIFQTNGTTEALRIDSSQKVGIGATTPAGKLEIAAGAEIGLALSNTDQSTMGATPHVWLGSVSAVGNLAQIAYGYDNSHTFGVNPPAVSGYIATSASGFTMGDLFFATRSVTTNTAPTERMRINGIGNVGIGTVSPTGNGKVLHLHNPSAGAYASTIHLTTADTGAAIGDGAVFQLDGNDELVIGTCDSERLILMTNGTEAMQIGVTGFVGIGTAAPETAFELQCNVNAGVVLQIDNDTAGTAAHSLILIKSDAVGAYLATYSASYTTSNQYKADSVLLNADTASQMGFSTTAASSPFVWYQENSEVMRLDGGYLGIGMTPARPFDMLASFQGWSAKICNSHSTNGFGLLINAGDDSAVSSFAVANYNSTETYLVVQGDGNLGVGPRMWGTHADWTSLSFGGNGYMASQTTCAVGNAFYISQNSHLDTDGSDEYMVTDEASSYGQLNGTHIWKVAASGTAGADISWTTAMCINSDASVHKPAMPWFRVCSNEAYPLSPLTGDGTNADVCFGGEICDNGGNFNGMCFIAPVAGVYSFSAVLNLNGITSVMGYMYMGLFTSNVNNLVYGGPYQQATISVHGCGNLSPNVNIAATYMDAADVAKVQINIFHGGKVVVALPGYGTTFTGALLG